MRLSKRLIKRIAEELIYQNSIINQYELHREIEKHLGRSLTADEKRRVSVILRNEYNYVKMERNKENSWRRIYYYTY